MVGTLEASPGAAWGGWDRPEAARSVADDSRGVGPGLVAKAAFNAASAGWTRAGYRGSGARRPVDLAPMDRRAFCRPLPEVPRPLAAAGGSPTRVQGARTNRQAARRWSPKWLRPAARRAGYCRGDRASQQPAALPCKAVGSKECQTCRYFANFVTLGLVMRAEFGSIVGSVSPRHLADNFHLHINHLRNIPEESPP